MFCCKITYISQLPLLLANQFAITGHQRLQMNKRKKNHFVYCLDTSVWQKLGYSVKNQGQKKHLKHYSQTHYPEMIIMNCYCKKHLLEKMKRKKKVLKKIITWTQITDFRTGKKTVKEERQCVLGNIFFCNLRSQHIMWNRKYEKSSLFIIWHPVHWIHPLMHLVCIIYWSSEIYKNLYWSKHNNTAGVHGNADTHQKKRHDKTGR